MWIDIKRVGTPIRGSYKPHIASLSISEPCIRLMGGLPVNYTPRMSLNIALKWISEQGLY